MLDFKTKDYAFVILLFLAELTRSAFFLTFWPLYAVKVLHLTMVSTGLIVSAHYLTETLFKAFAGSLLDRRGRSVLLLGLLLSLLAFLGIYQTQDDKAIFLLAGLFGLGFAPVWLAVISNVAPTDHPNRAARMGVVFAAWLLGAGAGPVGINFVLSGGFREVFQGILVLWTFCLVFSLFIPFTAKATNMHIPIVKQFRRLIKDHMVAKVLLPGMFLQTLAASLLLPVLPLYATQVLRLTSEQYGLLLTTGGAATVLMLIPMGRLVDRLPLQKVLTAGFLLSAVFLGLFPFVTEHFSITLLVILVGMSYALVLPAWNSLLARAIPAEHQATGWGIFTALEGLGIATGPVLGGMISGYLNPIGAIFLSAFILAAMGIFYCFYPFDQALVNQECEKCL